MEGPLVIPELQPKETPSQDSLGNGFLSKIPEQDRPIVEKYVKDWDSGVTTKFQELHNQYAPYKELGDIGDIQQALEVMEALRLDPKGFYDNLSKIMEELNEDDEMSLNEPPVEIKEPENADSSEVAQLKAALEDLSSKWTAHEQTVAEKAQMDELDGIMSKLHTEHGDFDDRWVLLQLADGVSPEDAIQKWNSLIDANVSSRKGKPAPIVLPGAGSIPNGQADPSKFSKSDRLAYIAQMLERAKQ
jgi:hypothetical protein